MPSAECVAPVPQCRSRPQRWYEASMSSWEARRALAARYASTSTTRPGLGVSMGALNAVVRRSMYAWIPVSEPRDWPNATGIASSATTNTTHAWTPCLLVCSSDSRCELVLAPCRHHRGAPVARALRWRCVDARGRAAARWPRRRLGLQRWRDRLLRRHPVRVGTWRVQPAGHAGLHWHMEVLASRLHLRVLGRPEVSWRGSTVRMPTRKALALACFLAVEGREVARTELAELLWWPPSPANLRTELHRLRRLPGAARWFSDAGAVNLHAETDLAAFERAVREERFAEAAALHPEREGLLHGLHLDAAPAFEEWAEQERRRVEALYREALLGHALALERRADRAEALACFRRLLARDPLDESAVRGAMRCEALRGRTDAARAWFDRCRRMLAAELGIEPQPDTLTLMRRITREGARARSIRSAAQRPEGLIGRAPAWASLEAAWRTCASIQVAGPAGVGKSALLRAFLSAKGRTFVLEGRTGDEAVPFSSLSRALADATAVHPDLVREAEPWVRAELGRVLPEVVGHGTAVGMRSDADRARFFEAFVRILARLRRRVDAVVVEDLHHLDVRSFEVGVAAQARLRTEGTLPDGARMLAAFRPEALPAPFRRALDAAVEAGSAVRLDVEPLGSPAVRALLAARGAFLDAKALARVGRVSGGNPRYVLEVAARLGTSPGGNTARIGAHALSTALRAVAERRLTALRPEDVRLLSVLAAWGRPADVGALSEVLDVPAVEMLEALEGLERARILRVGMFADEAWREAVARSTSPTTRRWIDRRVARVRSLADGNAGRRGRPKRRAAR